MSRKSEGELLIVAQGRMLAGREGDLRRVLATLQEAARRESGCRHYDAHLDGERLVMVERWADAQAFDDHTRTPTFVSQVPALKALLQDGAIAAEIVTVADLQSVVL